MKQKTAICLIFALLLTILCACNGNRADVGTPVEAPSQETEAVSDPEENSTPAGGEESGVSDMKIPQTGWTEAVPAEYTKAVAEQGAVVRLDYESEEYIRNGSPITKTAYVYSPYTATMRTMPKRGTTFFISCTAGAVMQENILILRQRRIYLTI